MIEEEERRVRESGGQDYDMLLKNNIEGIIIKWAYQVSLSSNFYNSVLYFRNADSNFTLLKGQCHEIFDFRLSTWISFPLDRAVSNFFENSRIYSQLKVQIEKNLQSENFSLFLLDTFG